MNILQLNTQGINDVGNLCDDPDTKGFDLQAGQSWIYPTNYPVREYQHNITQQALYRNTLVSLPTGLGKTFIAVVVMYNFYRWYPSGKVIFMAPTRPLVRQQMDACYNIMAIPQDTTAELTGTKVQQSRGEIWQNKRVFFITPQVLQNDLAIILELAGKIKCLVFDEAHRAKGNHAYCEVIRKLLPRNNLFRVLALSATPGNSSRDVLEVMRNLLIAHLEFRSEESPDVKPYVFERALETVVVPLGEKLEQIKEQYIQILEKYTRTLIKYKVIYGNCGNLTKGKIFMVMKEFQAKNSGNRTPNYAEIMKSLNICVTLYHAYESLIRCGLRAFLNFYEEHINNPLLNGNVSLFRIMEDLREYLGPVPEVQPLPDGTYAKISTSTKFGHPKFYQLREILVSHFRSADETTRVIVFFEYRESAAEAYALLSQTHPMIRSRVFVGQGSGVTQKDQINTVKAFREGSCNTLLSTCIGEEGLDVGEVDLIVCFDIANKSPIRMIQRMGRTGRKKEGRVVVLVTEGKEQQTLKDCLIYKNNLGNFVTNSEALDEGKYRDNPKMIPSYIQPKCHKMFITVKKPVLSKNSNLKEMLKSMSSKNSNLLSEDFEVVEIQERINSKPENLWNKEQPLEFRFKESGINFSKHLERQRSFQASDVVKSSKQTEILVTLLQFADSKRFNIPVTQKISHFSDFNQNKYLKQGDIRNMFSKPSILSQEFSLPNSQTYNFDKEKDITQSFPAELFDEISTYLSIDSASKETCKMCDLLFECPKTAREAPGMIDFSKLAQLDLSILDGITARDLEIFAESLSPKSQELYQELENDCDMFDEINFTQLEERDNCQQDGRNEKKSFRYETPRNFDKILSSFRVHADDQDTPKKSEEKSFAYETPKGFEKVLNLLSTSPSRDLAERNNHQTPKTTSHNLIAIDETVEETTPKNIAKLNQNKKYVPHHKDVLCFFKLSTVDDLFVNDEQTESPDLDKTVIYKPDINLSPDPSEKSPDLFSSSEEKQDSLAANGSPESPILCTYDRLQKLKAKKKLFDKSKIDENQVANKPNLANLNRPRKSFYESSKRSPEKRLSLLNISDICDLTNFGLNTQVVGEGKRNKLQSPKKIEADSLDISDICDLSIFGLAEPSKNTTKETTVSKVRTEKETNGDICDLSFGREEPDKIRTFEESIEKISDIFDVSIFGSPKPSKFLDEGKDTSEINKLMEKIPEKKSLLKPVKKNVGKELGIDDICNISDLFGESFSNKNKTDVGTKIVSASDLEDFCDFSSFLSGSKENKNVSLTLPNITKPVHDLSQSDKTKETTVVDLTDSDFDLSPVKIKSNTQANRTLSQLSITQMLSLIAKTDDPVPKKCRKENILSTPKTKTPQKPGLSLSNKKVVSQSKHIDSPKTCQKKTKKKYTIPLPLNSDDEFEEICKSPVYTKPKSVTKKNARKKSSSTQPKKKANKLFCEFLDEEAVLSEDENIAVSDDENSGEDCFEASFVADDTQELINTTNMQAQYLQSIKSPLRRGKFKIPSKLRYNVTNVFSQEVSNEDNSYINDSFCVNTEDVDACEMNDLSELELLEMKLKEMKKKRKKSDDRVNRKKRRIIVPKDDSD